ncbi:MAG: hypothetical protein E6J34_20335 [Chloroflexi bacterium]|nr:MAG: hypothetical protein E6J34_20335 [Chloroflexota bacterium]
MRSPLRKGLIQESKNEESRMCLDYRMLNSKTLKNAYPLPRIQDCIDKLDRAIRLFLRHDNGILATSYAENTDILNQHLHVDDEDEDFDEVSELKIEAPIGEKRSRRINRVMEEIMV